MIRTLIWFIYFWVSLIISIPFLWYGKLLAKRGDQEKYKNFVQGFASTWAKHLLFIAGTKITVKGRKHLTEDPVLFVGNHQGNFDIPIMIAYAPIFKGFIAKIELKKIPLIASWMRMLKCVFMDRKDMRQSIKAINEGASNIKEGYSMIVFPEGTRSKDGVMLPFKPGALKLATKTKCTIMPVTINGSKDIMVKGSPWIRPAKVTITIHPAFDVSEYGPKETSRLSDDLKAIIQSAL